MELNHHIKVNCRQFSFELQKSHNSHTIFCHLNYSDSVDEVKYAQQ